MGSAEVLAVPKEKVQFMEDMKQEVGTDVRRRSCLLRFNAHKRHTLDYVVLARTKAMLLHAAPSTVIEVS